MTKVYLAYFKKILFVDFISVEEYIDYRLAVDKEQSRTTASYKPLDLMFNASRTKLFSKICS